MTTLYQYVFAVALKYHSHSFVIGISFWCEMFEMNFWKRHTYVPRQRYTYTLPNHTILWVSNDPSTHVHSNSKAVNSTPVLQLGKYKFGEMGNHRTEKRKSTRTRQRTKKAAVITNMQTFLTALHISVAKLSCERSATSVAELKTTDDSGAHVNSLHPPSKKDFAISYWICRADHSLARSGITIWWLCALFIFTNVILW